MIKNTEYLALRDKIQNNIDNGTLKANANGIYRASSTFSFVGQISVRAKTADEAAEKLLALRDKKLFEKHKIEKYGLSFDEVAEKWINRYSKGNVSPASVNNYITIINKSLHPVFGNKGIKTIKFKDLDEFLVNEGLKYGNSQLGHERDCIKMIFRYAFEHEYTETNVAQTLKKPKSQVQEDIIENKNGKDKPLSDEDFVLALKASRLQKDMVIILCVLYVYGLRPVELLNLKWDWVNFDEDYFNVQKTKYNGSPRYLPLTPTIKNLLADAYENHSPNENNFIFVNSKNNAISTTNLDGYFKTLNRNMDILNGALVRNNKIIKSTNIRPFIPYCFRKGVVTSMFSMGYNNTIVNNFVGHKPKTINEKNYSKLTFQNELRPMYEEYINQREEHLIDLLRKAGFNEFIDDEDNYYTVDLNVQNITYTFI